MKLNELSRKVPRMKSKIPHHNKGRTPWNKGISPSKKTIEKMKIASRGCVVSEEHKQKLRKIKNINQIVIVLQNVFKYEGKLMKTEFLKNNVVREKLGNHNSVRDNLKRFGLTLDDIALQAGVHFKQKQGHKKIGKNEIQALDNIEKENNINLIRNFPVVGKFIDGYDPINNIAYEVDESFHKYQQVEDIIRENKIKRKLGCKFVRIKDGW